MKLFPTISSGKSGNREVAVALLLFWSFVTGYCFFFVVPGEFADYSDAWQHMTTATFMYTAAAFGFNYAVQQGVLRGSTERNRRTEDCRHPPARDLPAD